MLYPGLNQFRTQIKLLMNKYSCKFDYDLDTSIVIVDDIINDLNSYKWNKVGVIKFERSQKFYYNTMVELVKNYKLNIGDYLDSNRRHWWD